MAKIVASISSHTEREHKLSRYTFKMELTTRYKNIQQINWLRSFDFLLLNYTMKLRLGEIYKMCTNIQTNKVVCSS